MPCDLEPRGDGKFYLFRRTDCIEAISIKSNHESAKAARVRGDKTYNSHFSTCPNADQHRGQRSPASGIG